MSKSPQPPLLPSPFGDDPPLFPDTPINEHPPNLPDDLDHNHEGIPYINANDGQLLPPPNFAPFFTVIEDSATGEHYHPSIHYIFADDDQEILTAASMRELGYDDSRQPVEESGSGGGESTIVSPLPPLKPNIKERYLLIDVAADGQTITEAQSMSREWQITGNIVRPAPTWDEEALETGSAGLMLKVSGIELPGNARGGATTTKDILNSAKQESNNDLLGALDALAGKFEKGVCGIAKMADGEPQPAPETTSRSRGVSLSGV